MALDLWFREDVIRILRALASAGESHGSEYLRALHDVALAFGLDGPGPKRLNPPEIQPLQATDWGIEAPNLGLLQNAR